MLSSDNKKEQEREEEPFIIELENEKYCPGDTVKGTLVIVANRAFLATRLRLWACGDERIVIRKDKRTGVFSKKPNYEAEVPPPETVAEDMSYDWTISCSLYHKDLSSFMPYKPIEIPATTTKKFPFGFTLPKDVLESYSGQNLWERAMSHFQGSEEVDAAGQYINKIE